MSKVGRDWVEDLRHRGFTVVPGLLGSIQLERLEAKLPARPSVDAGAGTDKSRALTQLLLCSWSAAAVIRDLFFEPRVQWILGHFQTVPFIEHTKTLLKAAHGPETPWHQDDAFFHAFDPSASMLSLWIPLHPVERDNGCLEVIPGSHRWPRLEHRDQARSGEKQIQTASELAGHASVDVPLAPGDALVFHSRLVHRAHSNRSADARVACKVVFQDLSRRKPGYPLHPSSVRFDGGWATLNRALPCASARARIEAGNLYTASLSAGRRLLGSKARSTRA